MDFDIEQEIIRRAYAKQIMAAFGVSDRRILAAPALKLLLTDFANVEPAGGRRCL
jgi:hypothetical protein